MTYSPPAREAAFYFQQLLPTLLLLCEPDFRRVDTAVSEGRLDIDMRCDHSPTPLRPLPKSF